MNERLENAQNTGNAKPSYSVSPGLDALVYLLSPVGRCEAYPVEIQLFIHMFLVRDRRRILDLKTSKVYRLFLLQNVLSPKGMRRISKGGPTVFTYVLYPEGR